ncbi:NACHT, LRR and PYD domains-containing protein 10-like [Mustelus asterias]
MPPHINSAEVFFSYIKSLQERCGCATENSCSELLKIGGLAYEGICNNVVVFKEGQLKQHNLQGSRLTPVFMIEITDKEPHRFMYAFTHSVLQGFFGALMKIQDMSGNRLIDQLQRWETCSDDRFMLFSRFLFALSSRHSIHLFDFPFSELSFETHSVMSDWLKQNCQKIVDKLEDRRCQLMLLKLLHYIVEYGDRHTTMVALSQLNAMQFTKCHLQPSDYAALSRSLMDIGTFEELNLSACGVELETLNQLKDVLHKIKILRLNETKIGASGAKVLSSVLTKEACKIQTLD